MCSEEYVVFSFISMKNIEQWRRDRKLLGLQEQDGGQPTSEKDAYTTLYKWNGVRRKHSQSTQVRENKKRQKA